MKRRGSGILLHITSLPSRYGIGDLGPEAYRFADFLAMTGQSFWQILSLTPTRPASGNSPYNSSSAFAGNTLLISPELMPDKEDPVPSFQEDRVDYPEVISYKERLFNRAYKRFTEDKEYNYEYERFCSENSGWLEDFSFFIALKAHFHGPIWGEWPHEIKNREPQALQVLKKQLHNRIEREKFLQYIFFKQWFSLKRYCNQRGIQIIGDMPIYVDYDSTDVWTNPHIFRLDEEKRPSFVAGVPPDYFSQTGQLWGNPVYRWDILKESGYAWWIQRMEHNLKLFDIVRIDHFRGFIAYWQVRAGERAATRGQWIKAPAEDFFNTLLRHFPDLPIIAEDLGVITPDVREVMNRFEFPGMRLLLFAFDENLPASPYAPHNHVKNCVVYTGTHDNNTVKGWFEHEASQDDKERLFNYIGKEVSSQDVHLEFIRLAMMSVAKVAILPMQDILGIGEEGRMNRPAAGKGNWQWRLLPGELTPALIRRLQKMTEIYGRA